MQSKYRVFFLLHSLSMFTIRASKESAAAPSATASSGVPSQGNLDAVKSTQESASAIAAQAKEPKELIPVFNYSSEFQNVRQAAFAQLTSKPWHQVSQKYVQDLEQQEAALWQRFFALTTLKIADIHQLIKKHEKEYRAFDDEQMKKIKVDNADQLIPQLLKDNVASAAQFLKIEPSKITIILDPTDGELFRVGRSAVYVNSDILHFYDDQRFANSLYAFKEQEMLSLLVHEMWHILYQDRYLEWLGQKVFVNYLKNPKDEQAYRDLLVDFHHFVEYRADTLAGLSGMMYVLGLISLFESTIKTIEDNKLESDDSLHPSLANRVTHLKALYHAMRKSVETAPIK